MQFQIESGQSVENRPWTRVNRRKQAIGVRPGTSGNDFAPTIREQRAKGVHRTSPTGDIPTGAILEIVYGGVNFIASIRILFSLAISISVN
jgi:hypothetical protein